MPVQLGGRRVHLELEGAFQVALAWVNGKPAGRRTGGYTGFEFDITNLVKPGDDNLLVVRVDSTNSPDIPPANEGNVSMYGGLYRNVWMEVTSGTYVPEDGICITTPQVSEVASSVRVITRVKNTSHSTLVSASSRRCCRRMVRWLRKSRLPRKFRVEKRPL